MQAERAGNEGHSEDHDVILDSIAEGVFTVDLDWNIASFNRAAEIITGTPRERAIGCPCKEILRADTCERNCVLQETMQTGRPIADREVTIIDAEGERKSIRVNTALLRNGEGNTIGGVETFRDVSELTALRNEIRKRCEFHQIVSRNDRMLDLIAILPDLGDSGSTVLLFGESGTGKELFARAIHDLSARSAAPFVAVNCGALPDTLLESELFGYKSGAFTDARKDKPGRFAIAEGGTLFLDEIGDVSQAMQVRLLRFLQERVYEPLGSIRPVHADVRIVAATNHNLERLVAEGRFREDLYYRVNVVRLEIPPLRDRLEDVPLLVDRFIERLNAVQGKHITGISDRAMAVLMTHGFGGNVRELENIIEHAFVLCKSGDIEPRHLPAQLQDDSIGDGEKPYGATSLDSIYAAYIERQLREHGLELQRTAKALGIHRSTLYRKMKTLGIHRPSADIMSSRRRQDLSSVASNVAAAGKPGRNDPCPCGSGRKYKQCCGR